MSIIDSVDLDALRDKAAKANVLKRENNKLREALKAARRQLVTLGGDALSVSRAHRDAIQASVLEVIDSALDE